MGEEDKVAELGARAVKEVEDIVELIAQWRSGDRNWLGIARELLESMGDLVQITGELWDALEDREERQETVKDLILGALRKKGIDLPGPDEAMVEVSIKAAVFTWRHYRGKEPQS